MQTAIKSSLKTVNDSILTSVKACRKPKDLAEFSKLWNLDSTNTYTATSPKVIKNELISMAPTLVLYMFPTSSACPAAGTCRKLCLNTAGNPAYLKGKLACRVRRNNGSKFDTLALANKLGLNYLAAWKPLKGQSMPKLIKVEGKIYETFDADKTDFRPLDKSDKTRIGLLRYKRTPNDSIDLINKFCLKFEIVEA
jgi:hypothetical protein